MKKGFTLVELVIVIVIVGILSIIAVPVYKGYIDKAMFTEGKALASAVRTAQSLYYAEHGTYYSMTAYVGYDPIIDIDARSNKYYKFYLTSVGSVANTVYVETRDLAAGGRTSVGLSWEIDPSLHTMEYGHNLPFYFISKDGKTEYLDA